MPAKTAKLTTTEVAALAAKLGEAGGGVCPFCGNADESEMVASAQRLTVRFTCWSCEGTWTEHYKFDRGSEFSPGLFKSRPTAADFEGLGGLITFKGTDPPQVLGDLMYFAGRGVYDPTYGRVDVSPEHAAAHNKAWAEATIKGLDENCRPGQGGNFYVREPAGPGGEWAVTTFDGTVVAAGDDVEVAARKPANGRRVAFSRNGKLFAGDMRDDSRCVFFTRRE